MQQNAQQHRAAREHLPQEKKRRNVTVGCTTTSGSCFHITKTLIPYQASPCVTPIRAKDRVCQNVECIHHIPCLLTANYMLPSAELETRAIHEYMRIRKNSPINTHSKDVEMIA